MSPENTIEGHMPRRNTIRSEYYPYHVCARAHNKQWFPLPMEEMWEIFCEQISLVIHAEGAKVYAFVVMSNHFHLLVKTPRANIDKVMYWIMKKSTLEVQRRRGIINSIYGGRYKGSLLTNLDHHLNTYKYIMRNPVVAGLCEHVEDYPYSTLSRKINRKLNFALSPFHFTDYFANDEAILRWLNYSFKNEESDSIRRGLERPQFAYGKNDHTHRFVVPEITPPEILEAEVL